MRRIGGIITRWKQFRAGHMVAHGAIFWIAFWGGALAIIAWLYTPGGLGDPARDLHQPTTKTNRFACAKPCNKPADEPAAAQPGNTTESTTGRSGRTSRTTTPSPTPSSLLPSLPVPTSAPITPPDIDITIIDTMQIAGGNYLQYRVTATPTQAMDSLAITTDIPAKTYYTECTDQSGQPVCIDQRAGETEGHWMSWKLDSVKRNTSYPFEFWVHVEATAVAGTIISNHAHATWATGAVRSDTNEYRVGGTFG